MDRPPKVTHRPPAPCCSGAGPGPAPPAAAASSPPAPGRGGGRFITSPGGDFAGWETSVGGKELPPASTSLPSLPPAAHGPRRLLAKKGRNYRGRPLKPPACPMFLVAEMPVSPALLPTRGDSLPGAPPRPWRAAGRDARDSDQGLLPLLDHLACARRGQPVHGHGVGGWESGDWHFEGFKCIKHKGKRSSGHHAAACSPPRQGKATAG